MIGDLEQVSVIVKNVSIIANIIIIKMDWKKWVTIKQ